MSDCSSNLSFHLPIVCTVKADIRHEMKKNKTTINWEKCSNPQRGNYVDEVKIGIRNISSSYDTLSGNLNNVVDDLSDLLYRASNLIVTNKASKSRVKR